MGDIFSSLGEMGLDGFSKMKIYEDDKDKKDEQNAEIINAPAVPAESDLIFDKKVQCPVCDKEFKAKTVKTGKPRLLGSDSDLRPRYSGIDSIKYDAIVCPHCGYAALSRFFSYMTSTQAKLIKENVSSKFKTLPESGDTYTYDEAINRHKLALLNAVVKKAKNSERAYTCLKIAWLYRGKKENLPADAPNLKTLQEECSNNEKEMLSNAFEGFVVSRSKEDFPICGMDEATFDYLLADLAFRLGKYEISAKLASAVIVSRTATRKLKEKARDLRDIIKTKIKN